MGTYLTDNLRLRARLKGVSLPVATAALRHLDVTDPRAAPKPMSEWTAEAEAVRVMAEVAPRRCAESASHSRYARLERWSAEARAANASHDCFPLVTEAA